MSVKTFFTDFAAPYNTQNEYAMQRQDGSGVDYYDKLSGNYVTSYEYGSGKKAVNSNYIGNSLNSGLNQIAELLNSIEASRANNAAAAAVAAARETNSFNAEQAAINRAFQQTSAERAMQFESDMAYNQMNFQKEMSNTVYQRAVNDLKAAGLSPLLAYQNLQTSAPVGASGSGHSASGSAASGVKADVSSALGVERQEQAQMLNALALNINSAMALKRLDFDKQKALAGIASDVFSSVLGLVGKVR